MRSRLHHALAGPGDGYTELRLRRVWSTAVLVRDRDVEVAMTTVETGGLARSCRSGSGWGLVEFSGEAGLDRAVRRARELAAASRSRRGIALAPITVREFDGSGEIPDDPREVSLAEKRARAEALAGLLHAADRRIVGSRVLLRDEVLETWLATSEGGWWHEVRPEISVAALALSAEEGNLERALGSLGLRGGWSGSGPAEVMVREVANRAVERLHAAPVRPGRHTVVLDPAAAGALAHRAVAHLARPALPGADADVLPMGTRVGPDCMTIGDDPTAESLRPSGPCDDEGTVTRRTALIQNGVVVGHLQNRETAAATGQAPTGHARAGTLRGAPYPRAANTFFAAGQGSREDLLAGIETGVYVTDLLACEAAGDEITIRAAAARMIRRGRLAEAVKGVQISERLLPLLGRVEAVAGDFMWGTAASRCRDGALGVVSVTSGAPHVRFGSVPVGEGPA